MKKILTALMLSTTLATVPSTIVRCNTLNNIAKTGNYFKNNYLLQQEIKKTINSEIKPTQRAADNLEDLINKINETVKNFINSETDWDEIIKPDSVETRLFWNYQDDDISWERNASNVILEKDLTSLLTANFAVGIRYIEIELDDNEQELEYDAVSIINSPIDLSSWQLSSNQITVELEKDRDDTLIDFKSEVAESYFKRIENITWSSPTNPTGIPTEFLFDDDDDQTEQNNDVKLTITDGNNEITNLRDLQYNKDYIV